MREIKFRAWDKKEKCWVGGFAIHQSGMFSDWAGCKHVNGVCVADANWIHLTDDSNVVVMQYTGLHDKYGKEIYEGDILRDEFGRISQVYWVDREARFTIRERNRKTEYFMVISHLDVEVIGNIYENPELIKSGSTV